MIEIPTKQLILILARMFTLTFVGDPLVFSLEVANNTLGIDSNKGYFSFCRLKWKRILLFITLVCCCVANNLHNFIGLLATPWSILLLIHGYGDTRYVAKKFAACHFMALI
jgi:hypothetical protein